jgi:hypothetical protein
MVGQLGRGEPGKGTHQLDQKPFRIIHFKAVSAGRGQGDHLSVIRVLVTHGVGFPVNRKGSSLVDKPNFDGKGILFPKGDAEQITEQGQIFRIQGMFAGTELPDNLPLGKQYRFLGFPDHKLGKGAQIIVGILPEFPRKNVVPGVVPLNKVNKVNKGNPSLSFTEELSAESRASAHPKHQRV